MALTQLLTPPIGLQEDYDPVTVDMFFEDEIPTPLLTDIFSYLSELYEEKTGDRQATVYVVGGIAKELNGKNHLRKDIDFLIVSSEELTADTYRKLSLGLIREATDYFSLPIDVFVRSEYEIEAGEKIKSNRLIILTCGNILFFILNHLCSA